jgi:hypothetical protein
MKRKGFLGSIAISFLLIGVVVGIVMIANMNISEIIVSVGQRGWRNIVSADADPGGTSSGFMYFMVYPHQAAPGTAYAANLSNATAYEFSDSLNTEMTGETPYSTTFDFVLKFRVNTTVGYNTSGSRWEDSWVRANITCNFDWATDISTLSSMTIIQIGNNTQFAWYHAYINNAAAGYQIGKNERFNVTALTAEGYY